MGKGTCAITGASGFLGHYLVQNLQQSGWRVKRIQRKKNDESHAERDIVSFSMGKKLDAACLSDVDLLIHCAYDFSCTSWDKTNEINVIGTKLIFEAATAANVSNIVFISSMHAFEGCQTIYGKAKLASEKHALDHNAIIIRPGTIYGEKDGKLFGGQRGTTLELLEKLLRISPILLIPHCKEPTIYVSCIDDLYRIIEESIEKKNIIDNPICAVYNKPYTLKEFLLLIQKRHHNTKTILVSFPWKILWILLLGLEKIKIELPFRSESLSTFFDQNLNPDFSTLEHFTTTIRSF